MAKTPPKAKTKDRALDARETMFVAEYLIELNPEKAAIAAGYSQSVARSKAYQWVSNSKVKPHVYKAINAGLARLSAKKEITQERVLEEIAKVAFASKRHFIKVDEEGQPQINLSETDNDNLDALAEVNTETVLEGAGKDENGNPIFHRVRKTKIKMHDKLAALEKLARYTGMYDKEKEVEANAFARAIHEIQERTSKAPIRRDDPSGESS